MLFLPYKLDHVKHGVPFFTILVIAVCVLLFVDQLESDEAYNKEIAGFCASLSREDRAFLRELDSDDVPSNCALLFEYIRASESPVDELKKLAETASFALFVSAEENRLYSLSKLEGLYERFESRVPRNLTQQLAYDPSEVDWRKMLTSTIAHGDAFHLFGNLLFFYIFSAAVELLMGSLLYVVFFFTTTVTTSLAYSVATAGIENSVPTIGLSGVVMGTLAALAVLAPLSRIKCFFWFLLFFRTFSLPTLLIAFWYIGWDLFEMNRFGLDSGINYVAHVSGAATGALFAVVMVLAERQRRAKQY